LESKIKSSFIPDKMPAAPSRSSRRSRPASEGANIFVVIAIIVFAVSMALAAGVFLYDKYVITSSEAKSEQLQRERKLLEPATVRELMRLDNRLSAASAILGEHIAPSTLFTILERLTLKSVYFKDLEFSLDESDGITIRMQGNARTVNGVALQADIFAKSRVIINPIFSNLDIVDDGVDFEVTATIPKTSLQYAQVKAFNN